MALPVVADLPKAIGAPPAPPPAPAPPQVGIVPEACQVRTAVVAAKGMGKGAGLATRRSVRFSPHEAPGFASFAVEVVADGLPASHAVDGQAHEGRIDQFELAQDTVDPLTGAGSRVTMQTSVNGGGAHLWTELSLDITLWQ